MSDIREKLEFLAASWQERVQLGPYCSREEQLQANVYDDCSDELIELIASLTN